MYIGDDKSNGPRKVWQWIRQKIINPVLTVLGLTAGCDVLGALVLTKHFNWSLEAKTVVTAGCSCIGLIVGIKVVTSNN